MSTCSFITTLVAVSFIFLFPGLAGAIATFAAAGILLVLP